jgi:hypothetical protein
LIEPFAPALLEIANYASEPGRRLEAIRALSGGHFESVSNSVSQLLTNSDFGVRSNAVRLLADFPVSFADQALRRSAKDSNPGVRAQTAQTIGDAGLVSLLPVIEDLLADPVGLTNPLPPLTLQELREGGKPRVGNNNDVHLAAGYALLQFDLSQSGDILRRHLDDRGFRPQFLCKLAEKDPAPWLTNLVEILEERRARIEKEMEKSGVPQEPKNLWPRLALNGVAFNCWSILYGYLESLPRKAFANEKLDWCLSALEKSGTAGSVEQPLKLYELYKSKGLRRRAAQFRARTEASTLFNIKPYFDTVRAR